MPARLRASMAMKMTPISRSGNADRGFMSMCDFGGLY